MHGQMRPARAPAGDARPSPPATAQVLVATTVIEVGIDVPNATVMLVEDAERYGISQLHQLRGRIGRGGHESLCLLFGPRRSPRLRALARHQRRLRARRDRPEPARRRGRRRRAPERAAGVPSSPRCPPTRALLESARRWAAELLDARPGAPRARARAARPPRRRALTAGAGADSRVRVIAGRLGGRRLQAPRGRATRPTSERVREALFSLLGPHVDGGARARPLRGHRRARHRGALAGRRANRICRAGRAALAALAGQHRGAATGRRRSRGRVARVRWRRLRARGRARRAYDLVFVDPPYAEVSLWARELAGALVPVLAPHALVAVESAGRAPCACRSRSGANGATAILPSQFTATRSHEPSRAEERNDPAAVDGDLPGLLRPDHQRPPRRDPPGGLSVRPGGRRCRRTARSRKSHDALLDRGARRVHRATRSRRCRTSRSRSSTRSSSTSRAAVARR